jgi:hypothetical protein
VKSTRTRGGIKKQKNARIKCPTTYAAVSTILKSKLLRVEEVWVLTATLDKALVMKVRRHADAAAPQAVDSMAMANDVEMIGSLPKYFCGGPIHNLSPRLSSSESVISGRGV